MTSIEFSTAKELKIDFIDVRYGLIFFRMTLDGKSYETRFSDVFDPLTSFKNWLEAISIGVNQCSFWFETEGEEIKFNFERESYKREVFNVVSYYDDNEIYLSGEVERRQLVEAFYLGLLEFYLSLNLLKENWEVEYIWERLSAILKLEYKALLEELAILERKELKQTLFKAAPRYLVSCPTAPEEAFGYLIDNFMRTEIPSEYEIIETPMEWNIPEDYDEWELKRKRELVKKCLSEKANDYEGSKIRYFRSKIIEDYLGTSSLINFNECIA